MNHAILCTLIYVCTLLYIHTFPQVHAFTQLGKTSGRSSVSIAVDVTTNLMIIKGITPKFVLDELRDNI